MKTIKKNPFRILGLPVNSTEREIQKQVSILKRFAEIGKTKDTAYDFNFLGVLNRDIEAISQSEKKIEQVNHKIRYILFWFAEITNIDETCLAYLKDNNPKKANEIWSKTLKESVTESNFSSYYNLSTLYLFNSQENGFDLDLFKKAISMKEKLINSNFFRIFIGKINCNNLSLDTKDILNIFIEEIMVYYENHLKNSDMISTNEFLSIFKDFPEECKYSLSSIFTEKPISEIEKNIDNTIELRKSDVSKSNIYGERLYKNTKFRLIDLKSILGEENLKFTLILNKLANEILQCSIEYFNYYRENDLLDPGTEALRIAKLAVSLKPTGQTMARIEENLPVIKEWIETKPQREKFNKVKEQNTFILQKLESLNNQRQINLDDVESFLSSCKPKLNEIGSELGFNDKDFINISTIIAMNSQGIVVEILNNVQSSLTNSVNPYMSDIQKKNIISDALNIFSKCNSLMNKIADIDMNEEARNKVDSNRRTISQITKDLNKIINPPSSGGCYIATMAYGGYDHPQVLKLRKYRDRVLLNNKLGVLFVKIYYYISPKFVKIFTGKILINKLIKRLLDIIIEGLNL